VNVNTQPAQLMMRIMLTMIHPVNIHFPMVKGTRMVEEFAAASEEMMEPDQ
jgi:hypothetical protein